MTDQLIKMKFPKVRKITLRNFTLYSSQSVIDIELNDGVFCLAGANGLGKSTFLTAINYGLTGIVSDPARKFESVEEFYRDNLSFSEDFFTGRIEEADRDASEVTIHFLVDDCRYELTRGMFEPNSLRNLNVYQANGDSYTSIIDTSEMSPQELHEEYAKRLANDVGLDSFDQFVFLQYYIFTFDERRHLLFWDYKILEQALFLAFGVDVREAKQADNLRREYEKADSRVRNYQWQATITRQKIEEIEETMASISEDQDINEDLGDQHRHLLNVREAERQTLDKVEGELRDAKLRFADYSSQQSSLRYEYAEEFSRHIQKHSHIAYHPLVVSSVDESQCGLCGTSGTKISKNIKLRVQTNECPLCGSAVEQNGSGSRDIKRLQQIDSNIEKIKTKLDDVQKIIARLSSKLERTQNKLAATQSALDEFEKLNSEELSKLEASEKKVGDVEPLLEAYRKQMEERLKKKKEQLDRREEKRTELLKLQRRLQRRYSAVEEEFVPLFKDLAHRFLGLDLSISMETHRSKGTTLVLDVKGSARRSFHQLSESQRFFIDIALRMALAQYISSPTGKACLFIDTPEGSLDIAYESRAGDMLAQFVKQGHNIIMTANINTSRLLLSLAEQCGIENMALCRMTTWTELSDVQIAEEGRFKIAYKQIEGALGKKASKKGKNG